MQMDRAAVTGAAQHVLHGGGLRRPGAVRLHACRWLRGNDAAGQHPGGHNRGRGRCSAHVGPGCFGTGVLMATPWADYHALRAPVVVTTRKASVLDSTATSGRHHHGEPLGSAASMRSRR